MIMGKHIAVIGAGVAGMECAGRLGRLGHTVTLIEKEESTGGNAARWYQLFPDRRPAGEVMAYINDTASNENVELISGVQVNRIVRSGRGYRIETGSDDSIMADAVVVATGFSLFDAARKEEYGYGIYSNVVTSAELEDMFRNGRVLTAAGVPPKRVGIIHCVGSRDEKAGNFHCSKVCCVTAVKQAIEIREHLPETQVFCFYMDMRMFGPCYEELYRESQEKWNVNYIRGRVSEAGETIGGRVAVKVEDTLAGRPLRMEVDMLVLMVGMEMSASGAELAAATGLETGVNRFLSSRDNHFGSNEGGMEGVFYAGTCVAPMNITDSLSHARAAVLAVDEYLQKSGE